MIATIIVGYKNEALTTAYIQQELSKLTVQNLVVVVNNASTPASCRYLESSVGACVVQSDFSGFQPDQPVYVIHVKENLGFAKANNLGVDFVRTFFPEVAYVLFSNNDIRIIDAQVVDVLISKYESVKGIGIITPNILSADGTRQTPMPAGSLWHGVRADLLYLLTHIRLKDHRAEACASAQEGFYDTFSECFFLSRVQDYVACGMMDPHTFLYAEGNILSERMSRIGLGYYFVPSVSVIHDNGTTTSQHIGPDTALLMAESNAYYYKHYRGYSSLSVGIYLLLAKVMNRLAKAKQAFRASRTS